MDTFFSPPRRMVATSVAAPTCFIGETSTPLLFGLLLPSPLGHEVADDRSLPLLGCFADAKFLYRLFVDILNRLQKQFISVSKATKSHIALLTKQTANLSSCMAVVNRQTLNLTVSLRHLRLLTDGTQAILLAHQIIILGFSHTKTCH